MEKCEWEFQGQGYPDFYSYSLSCGEPSYYPPKKNKNKDFKYCPYCSKEIKYISERR